MYAKIENHEIVKTGARPRWRKDNGESLTDTELVDHGWLPVVENRPDYDPMTERVERDPQDQWTVGTDAVTVSYTVVTLTAEEQAEALDRLRQQKQQEIAQARVAAQAQGFEHDGKTWSLSERAAARMSRMTARVTGFSELPRGKQTQTVRDLAGVPHDLDQEGIRALVRAGHDAVDELDDTEDELLEQIATAQTVEELEAIQWPE